MLIYCVSRHFSKLKKTVFVIAIKNQFYFNNLKIASSTQLL